MTDERTRLSARTALVVGQVALSLVLVMAAGLLLGSFRNLSTLDPGFRREGVLLASINLRSATTPAAERRTLYGAILDRLRALPGVRSASASEITPISGTAWNGIVTAEGATAGETANVRVNFNAVSDGYFATLGTALVAGRDVGPQDVPGAPEVAVINESAARRLFGQESPLGRRYRSTLPGDRPGPLVEIVGVVQDAKYHTLAEEPPPTIYLPMGQSEEPGPFITFALRTDGPPTALTSAVTAAVAQVDPTISLVYTTFSDQVSRSLTRPRLLATLSGFFGMLALLLSIIGLYGTVSYSVARRRSEIGIRLALGAARARVLHMVLSEVGRIVAVGLVLGAGIALAVMRLVSSFLYGRTASDPTTLAISAATMAVAAVMAGALPAWRAARLDPMEVLREE